MIKFNAILLSLLTPTLLHAADIHKDEAGSAHSGLTAPRMSEIPQASAEPEVAFDRFLDLPIELVTAVMSNFLKFDLHGRLVGFEPEFYALRSACKLGRDGGSMLLRGLKIKSPNFGMDNKKHRANAKEWADMARSLPDVDAKLRLDRLKSGSNIDYSALWHGIPRLKIIGDDNVSLDFSVISREKSQTGILTSPTLKYFVQLTMASLRKISAWWYGIPRLKIIGTDDSILDFSKLSREKNQTEVMTSLTVKSLEQLTTESLEKMSHLRKLAVYSDTNNLKKLETVLPMLPRLETLKIADLGIDEIPSPYFRPGLRSLKVTFYYNFPTGQELENLTQQINKHGGITTLEVKLSLYGGRFINVLYGLDTVTKLNLSKNALEGVNLRTLATGMKNLACLLVAECGLDENSLDGKQQSEQLKVLNIANNPRLTSLIGVLDKIAAAFPNLKFLINTEEKARRTFTNKEDALALWE